MIFIFKEKPIIIDCFSADQNVVDLFPIQKASKFFPEWWKKLPKTYFEKNVERSTMKSCYGFTEHYQHGFIIPLWLDLNIHVNHNSYEWKSMSSLKIDEHPQFQRGDYLNDSKYGHLKIISSWKIKCNEKIHFTYTQPVWNFNIPEELIIPPGTLEFKYQHTTNINAFVKFQNNPKNIFLRAGQPMVHITPLSERPIKIKNHLISQKEMDNMYPIFSFKNSYYKLKKLRKEKESRCPFGFDKKD